MFLVISLQVDQSAMQIRLAIATPMPEDIPGNSRVIGSPSARTIDPRLVYTADPIPVL